MIICMAMVAIKGGKNILVTPIPLTAPQKPPTRIPKRMAAGSGNPHLVKATPLMTLEKVITAPTEMSIPCKDNKGDP